MDWDIGFGDKKGAPKHPTFQAPQFPSLSTLVYNIWGN